MNRLILTLSILSILVLTNCKKEDTKDDPKDNPIVHKSLKTTVQYNKMRGVKPNLLSLDVYYNDDLKTQRPVVIYVHGGGWCVGDKSQKISNKVSLMKQENYVFVSVNYRLSPYPYLVNDTKRIKYPVHNNDIADAIKWVYDSIGNYGGNTSKIVLFGHSAGAHLSSLTGLNSKFLINKGLSLSVLKGVGSIDVDGYDIPKKIAEGSDVYLNGFGNDNSKNIDASPLFNIKNGVKYPKFFVAKRGKADRLAQSNKFIKKLKDNGVDVSEVTGSIYDHPGINDAIGDQGETLITSPFKAFLKDCFK